MNKSLAKINVGDLRGPGPLSDNIGSEAGVAALKFNELISTTIGLLTIVAAIWFIFQFLIGAIQIITAGGDKTQMENARKKITNSVIGIVVTIAAIFFIRLLGTILGFENILDPGNFIINSGDQSR